MHALMMGLDLRGISSLNGWSLLQEDPVKVEWLEYKGYPISRAQKILQHDMQSVAKIIQDLDQYLIF